MKPAKRSDWKTQDLPAQRSTLVLDRTFSFEEIQRIQLGVVPEAMEDKWFVYWQDDQLTFHRSWTGVCAYIVRFVPEGDAYRMVSAEVNRDATQYSATDDEYDVAMISYLIDVLLLDQMGEFPSTASTPEDAALEQWGSVGRAMLGQHPDNPDSPKE